mmetsp:Transcript_88258/g.228945  ORF Transcript_88258/g.228945 Transcript_88258/m.228945 type:complete len:345 (-) Transcript_88258:102-1136(-)
MSLVPSLIWLLLCASTCLAIPRPSSSAEPTHDTLPEDVASLQDEHRVSALMAHHLVESPPGKPPPPLPPSGSNECDNKTWKAAGGPLMTMSWHLHFTYAAIGDNCTGACKEFANRFIERFRKVMPTDPYQGCGVDVNWNNPPTREWCEKNPGDAQCESPYVGQELPFICSLIPPDSKRTGVDRFQNFAGPGRGFFVPNSFIDDAWNWAIMPEHQGDVDIFLHPNTGCMNGDHWHRSAWHPGPLVKHGRIGSDEIRGVCGHFPCNKPGAGDDCSRCQKLCYTSEFIPDGDTHPNPANVTDCTGKPDCLTNPAYTRSLPAGVTNSQCGGKQDVFFSGVAFNDFRPA